MRGGPRRLDQRVPEIRAPLVRLPRQPLTCALMVARTHPGPTRQVRVRGEARHVHADLRDYRLRRPRPHARDSLQQPDGFNDERISALSHLRVYLLVDAEDGRPYLVEAVKQLREDEALRLRQPP